MYLLLLREVLLIIVRELLHKKTSVCGGIIIYKLQSYQ
jgi:hypothetical protein